MPKSNYERTKAASLKYHKQMIKKAYFDLNRVNDSDIIDWLDRQPNRQGYLKELIRADIKAKSGQVKE